MATTQTNAHAKAVTAFAVTEWRVSLDTNALHIASAGKQVLDLVLAARGLVEVDTAKEAIQHAFANAHALTGGCTFEEACKNKSVQNRVSDAMAVFKAEVLPTSMPNHIQGAAKACRELNAKPRAPRTPAAKPEADAEDTVQLAAKQGRNPLALLEATLNALKLQCGSNVEALSLVSDLVDMAGELANLLSNEAPELSEAV